MTKLMVILIAISFAVPAQAKKIRPGQKPEHRYMMDKLPVYAGEIDGHRC